LRRAAIEIDLLFSCKPDLAASRALLGSQNPAEREKGAEILRKAYAKDPVAFGDHGETYWADKLKKVPGTAEGPGGKSLGGEGGGGGFTENYQLDDFWAATVWGNQKDHVYTGYDPPRRLVKSVAVAPPSAFTGEWKTFFVDGAVYEIADYENGRARRRREFHDNGQLRVERTIVDGQLEGTFVWRFADGTTEWEESYAKGKKVGVERRFWPGGKMREEMYWLGDKLEGRSAFFDKDGKRTQCSEYHAGERLGPCPDALP
jgi:hypothetical protein